MKQLTILVDLVSQDESVKVNGLRLLEWSPGSLVVELPMHIVIGPREVGTDLIATVHSPTGPRVVLVMLTLLTKYSEDSWRADLVIVAPPKSPD